MKRWQLVAIGIAVYLPLAIGTVRVIDVHAGPLNFFGAAILNYCWAQMVALTVLHFWPKGNRR